MTRRAAAAIAAVGCLLGLSGCEAFTPWTPPPPSRDDVRVAARSPVDTIVALLPTADQTRRFPNGESATNCDYPGNVVSPWYRVSTEYEDTVDVDDLRRRTLDALVRADWGVSKDSSATEKSLVVAEKRAKADPIRVEIHFVPRSGSDPPRIDVEYNGPCLKVQPRK